MVEKDIDVKIIKLEKQILYYLLSDAKHIQYIFNKMKVKTNYFQDFRINMIVKILSDNYDQHQSVLVREELLLHLDTKASAKIINETEFSNVLDVYDDVTHPDKFDLKDDQFNRIFKDWLEVEASPRAKKIIHKHLPLIESKGLEGVAAMNEELERTLVKPDQYVSSISSLDLKRDISRQAEDFLDRRDEEKRAGLIGIKTGIKKLDNIFAGFEKKSGSLTLIGGLVGHGKSTLMLNFSLNQCKKKDIAAKVLVVTLEMPDIQWARKLNCIDLQMKYLDFLSGNKKDVSESSAEKFLLGLKDRSENFPGEYKILFIPAEAYSWEDIVGEIDKRFPGYDPDIIYIDQLSLINLGKHSNERRDVALGLVARDIRAYAQTRSVAIALAVQANRSSIQRSKSGEKEIDISIENVEDSNKVGAHADNFIAIHQAGENKVFIKIAKQREGAKKVVCLTANQEFCVFYDETDIDVMNCLSEEIKLEDFEEDEDETGAVSEMKNSLDDAFGITEEREPEKKEDKIAKSYVPEDENTFLNMTEDDDVFPKEEEIKKENKEQTKENKDKTKQAIMDM